MRTSSSWLAWVGTWAVSVGLASVAAHAAETRVPLEFRGGHDIGKHDFGRPVVLIAAALGVKPDEFRQAFSGVTPAKGRGPTGDEARRNKDALLRVLSPLGVTNDRLDEVSNHYRYQPQRGELWKTTPAKGHAVIENGQVQRIEITAAGSGYSSPPQVTIAGHQQPLKAVLHFDRELAKNGSIARVELAKPVEAAK